MKKESKHRFDDDDENGVGETADVKRDNGERHFDSGDVVVKSEVDGEQISGDNWNLVW